MISFESQVCLCNTALLFKDSLLSDDFPAHAASDSNVLDWPDVPTIVPSISSCLSVCLSGCLSLNSGWEVYLPIYWSMHPLSNNHLPVRPLTAGCICLTFLPKHIRTDLQRIGPTANARRGFHWIYSHSLCVLSTWFTKAAAHYAVSS